MLTLFKGVDAACAVMCLDEGWACSSTSDKVLQMSPENLSIYRSQILETFTLSLYGGQGFGYILDQNGDILLRSVPSTSARVYGNVFDALVDTHNAQEDIDAFRAAIDAQETDSIIFDGDNGLGMAITKSLVDLMGGTIHVESGLGEGSTFTMELELRIQEQEDNPRFWADHRVGRMIVADDEEVCRNIVKTMSRTGVVTDYSTDGGTAIRMMREAREAGRPYDLILLDVQMPVMDGYEATRTIRDGTHREARHIPIIAMTANAFVDDVRDAIESGMDAHIAKPVQIDNLKATIGQVLDSRLAQAQGSEGT